MQTLPLVLFLSFLAAPSLASRVRSTQVSKDIAESRRSRDTTTLLHSEVSIEENLKAVGEGASANELITKNSEIAMSLAPFQDPVEEYEETAEEYEVDKCSGCGAPGTMGPVLVIYVTYKGASPEKTLEQVKAEFFGVPGLSDVFTFSSWGQTTLTESDVDFFVMESTVDPDTWGKNPGVKVKKPLFGKVKKGLTKQQAYKDYKTTGSGQGKSYQLEMMVMPGTKFQADAQRPGRFSRYRGNSITWQAMAHEIAHNWGLSHAGGFYKKGFHEYADDALMGVERKRASDFNAVARYNFGWIPASDVAVFPSVTNAPIHALNEGPSSTVGAKLVLIIPCTTCQGQGTTAGGNLYVSFRVKDPTHPYGVALDDKLYQKGSTSLQLKLVDRVHVHFQRTGKAGTELWTTIDEQETYQTPGSDIWIHVCQKKIDTATEFAMVGASATSAADAVSSCMASTPPTQGCKPWCTATIPHSWSKRCEHVHCSGCAAC